MTIAATASATDLGSESGNVTKGCAVSWTATAVLDANLTNDDPDYPNLMVDMNGDPAHYTNGGYIDEVSPLFDDPGLFEANHFYVGTGPTQVWRFPTATDFTIEDAVVTFTVPTELAGAGVVTFDAESTNSRMHLWGGNYENYSWAPVDTEAVDNGDGTFTIDLGTIAAGNATVFQFNIDMTGTGFTMVDRFIGTATLSGTYAEGEGCEAPEPTTTSTEWTATAFDCTTKIATETRETSTTTYSWSREANDWVANEPTVVTETQTRDMTADEIAAECTPTETKEPQPPVEETTTPQPPVKEAPQTGGLAATGADSGTAGLAAAGVLVTLGAGLIAVRRLRHTVEA